MILISILENFQNPQNLSKKNPTVRVFSCLSVRMIQFKDSLNSKNLKEKVFQIPSTRCFYSLNACQSKFSANLLCKVAIV